MKRIGLLSDTHGFLDESIVRHFQSCDEIWHAGDFGSADIADELAKAKPLRAVFGNIDSQAIRIRFPEELIFTCEEVGVFMTHIGGTPSRYASGVKAKLAALRPKLFICGHSHILRISYDQNLSCLYMNPGAAGKQGWHKMRTIVRFVVDGNELRNCEVIELGAR